MENWKRKGGVFREPNYVTTMDAMEREVVGYLAALVTEKLAERVRSAPKDELAELTGIGSGHKDAPTDPSLARLLPDFELAEQEAFPGDISMMRSLHEADICREKVERLILVCDKLGPDQGDDNQVVLTQSEAEQWVGALTDIRLFLASAQLQLESDAFVDRDEVLQWLGFQLESLLEAMMG